MTEVEKLYKLAGFKIVPKCEDYSCVVCDEYEKCARGKYPPFTAEKQIELIKILSKLKDFEFESVFARNSYIVGCRECESNDKHWAENKEFEQALAELIINLWQDLTSEEQEQIREILI